MAGITPPGGRPRPWLNLVSLAVSVLGTVPGAWVAWLFYVSGTQCRDEWIGHVAVSYLILIAAPATGVVTAHAGRHRAARRPHSTLEIIDLVTTWIVFVVVAGGGAMFAAVVLVFADSLSC